MIVLDRVPLESVERYWPYIEPHLQRGIDAVTTELTTDFVKAEALADRRMLWAIIDTDSPFPFLGAASAGQRMTNAGLVVFIEAIGGRDGRKWIRQCLGDFEEQARIAGAVKIEIEGRRGWRRVLPGFHEARVVMSKDL